MNDRRTFVWTMVIMAMIMFTAPVAMAANCGYTAAETALYPAGIGFNPAVCYNVPNFAQSPNLRKFMDKLPGLGAANKNALGQYIPVATPDITSYPGSDYYELGIKQFALRMHTDLPATTLRGYYQKNGTDSSSQYLGAAIIAKRDRPVRIKYFNELPTGASGNLFLPVDTTIMGAGMGPTMGMNYTQNRANIHLHGGRTPWISDGTPHQWITPAGDPDAAAGGAAYQKGAAFMNVPDMINGSVVSGVPVACIGGAKCYTPAQNDGIGTLYYSNEQSSRLMFYHDHAYGITRLNVYGGMAAPYILTSQVEEDLISGTNVSGANPANKQILPDQAGLDASGTGLYKYGIPLVIQDKSYVNDSTTPVPTGFPAPTSGYVATRPTLSTDPLWASYAGTSGGNLWLPHEYLPIENIFDPTGNTWNGKWDYAPFMNPPMVPTNLMLPSPSLVPEAFMDTITVNGTAFPYIELPPDVIRFRILSAGDDRALNLHWFKADPLRINVTNGGSGYSAPVVTISGNTGTYTSAAAIVDPGSISAIDVVGSQHYIFAPTVTLTGGGGTCASVTASVVSNSSGIIEVTANGCAGFTSPPTVTITGGGGGTYQSATASIIPKGTITGIVVTGAAGYRSDLPVPSVLISEPTGSGAGATAVAFVNTEVKMVDAAPNNGWPNGPSDGRDGGVPDPATAGPTWIQIGNESGFLAQAVLWPPQPVVYEQSRQSIPTLGVAQHSLLLQPAMRGDVLVDFSAYKDGDVLILYNDAPAPMPGFWPTNDYYTDNPDMTGVGSAPTTAPGFGPNTRTVMQVRIKGTKTSNYTFNLADLQAALPQAFAADQDKPLAPQVAYNAAFPGFATYDTYASNKDATLNLTGTGQSIARILTTIGGNGYTTPPTVTILPKTSTTPFTPATATAGLNPMGGITLLTAGAGYTAPPVVTIGSPASTYTAPAAPPAGVTLVTATATATVSGGLVTALAINEPGSYYNTSTADPLAVPTCVIAPPTGCVINGTTCVQATCSSFIAVAGSVGSITLTNPGAGYTSEPLIYLIGGGGMGATADGLLNGALVMTGKNMTEGFDPDFGRMDVRLGSTPNPLTPGVGNGQVIGIARYIDPPTEFVNDGEPILWRITHLGVDSHSMHFHLFDVQVVNHVDFTNVVKPPYPDELGWRETIRTNPMEDIIVAIRPRSMTVPFPMPTSNRVLDVTNPVNVNTNFLPIAPPPGIAAVPQIVNAVTDFGWEYVWHCHLLSHEENDMMRPLVLTNVTNYLTMSAPTLAAVGSAGTPALTLSPTSLVFSAVTGSTTAALAVTATDTGTSTPQVTLTWTDTNTYNNTGFTIQRNGVPLATVAQAVRTYTDTAVVSNTTYTYAIAATSTLGGISTGAWATTSVTTTPTPLTITTIGISGANAGQFAQSNTCGPLPANLVTGATCTISVTYTAGTSAATASLDVAAAAPAASRSVALTGTVIVPPAVPLNLAAAIASSSSISLSWTDNSTTETSFAVYGSVNNGAFSQIGTVPRTGTQTTGTGGTVTFTQTGLTLGNVYSYYVTAVDAAGPSGPSNTVSLTLVNVPTVGVTVSANRATATTTLVSPAFSVPSANQLILAFVTAGNPSLTAPATTVTGVTGGGLTWTLVSRSNTQRGSSEVWRAMNTAALTNVTATANINQTVYSGSITVMSFANVDTTGTNGSGAIGATNSANAATGAPSASLVTTRANSLVFGAGNDWDTATARTLGPNQTMVNQYLSPTADTYWVQRQTALIPAAGTTVTINDTAPVTDRWNLTIVEVRSVPPSTPIASVSPAAVNFGNQSVNTTSPAQTVTLVNSGGSPLTINSIGLSGTNAANFTLGNGCTGGTLAAGATCALTLTFTPPALGAYNASLNISSNDPVNPALTVPLSGTGAAAAVAIDATVFADSTTYSTTLVSPAFSTTSANELLLAFVASSNPNLTDPATTVNSVTGGGLTWSLVARSNTQRGSAEIWRAFSATPLTNASVTATLNQGEYSGSITIVTFTGVDTTGTNGSGAIGAVATGNAGTGAPSVSLVTTRANSWVFGVGNDWDTRTARTLGPNQTMVHQFLSPTNDTYWVQRQNSATPAAGTTVTINDTAPTTDRWNMSIVEIRTP